jgi:KDO2-lipid IV(A) lauroyltransferase
MRLLYYLVLKPISLLPRGILYVISDILAIILHRVAKYRRDIIEKNLAISFPDRDPIWIQDTTKAFYKNLADVIVESIQAFSMSTAQSHYRMKVVNPEVFQKSFDNGRSVIITGGHYVSWESTTFIANRIPHELYALYKPLKNKFMEKKVKKSREGPGIHMIPITKFRPYIEEKGVKPRAFAFGIDQSPRKNRGVWMNFLNRESLVFTGPERLSKEFDVDIVAARLERIDRGQYEVRFELLFDNPRNTAENEITITTNKDLERQILRNPANWLWSHNRWKHSRDDG